MEPNEPPLDPPLTWKCVPLVDPLNALLSARQNGLPPTPDTLYLGCSCHLHSSHCFLSTRGAVMLEKTTKIKKKLPQKWQSGYNFVVNKTSYYCSSGCN